ncbi:MAG: hypothetical protein JW871_05865 [Endomicrobiales bacterium]|nr:hypothetical protein [Endomicrobiales bacterium]
MIKENKKYQLILILTLIIITSSGYASNLTDIGRVTGVYQRAKSTLITVELDVKLPIGVVVFINKDIKAVIGDQYNDEGGKYHYEAVLSGKGEIERDSRVYAFGSKEKEEGGEVVYLQLTRKVKFEPKKQGKVLAAYGPKIHIDRGSLHEVKDRDIYAIYDSSGRYKGNIEARGVGDYQTITRLATGGKTRVKPGDTVIYLGRRRFFGLGILYGQSFPIRDEWEERPKNTGPDQVIDPYGDLEWLFEWEKFEKSVNIGKEEAGLLWEWTFSNGWGIQWYWGVYTCFYEYSSGKYRDVIDTNGTKIGTSYVYSSIGYSYKINFPLVIKKNFFYPKWFSPYFGVGAALLRARFRHYRRVSYYQKSTEWPYRDELVGSAYNIDNEAKLYYLTVFPSLGVNLFSSNTIHVIIDGKYIPAWRRLKSGDGEDHTWSGWICSVAVTTNW